MLDATVERIIMGLTEKSKWYRHFGLDTESLKRMVRLECRKNLALLEPLQLSKKRMARSEAVLVAVARNLELGAFEALLGAGDHAEKALSELRKVKIPARSEDGVAGGNEEAEGGTAVDIQIIRLHVRMHAVVALADVVDQLPAENRSGMMAIDFRLRLRNIQQGLLAIDRALAPGKKSSK